METKKLMEEMGKEALAEGQLPSNEQIKAALDVTEQALQKEKAHLGWEGKKIVRDVHEVAEAARVFLDERNPDESLQKMYHEAFKLRQTLPEEIDKVTGLPTDNEIRLAQETLSHLRYVGFLLLNSATFRRLVLRLLDTVRWTVRERMEEIDTSPLTEEGKTIGEAVSETAQSAKEVLKNEKDWGLNENEKEEIRQNMREIFRQLGGNEHFQKGTQSLFLLIDRLNLHLRAKAEETQGLKQKIERNPHVQTLMDESYKFLIALVGKDTVDILNNNFDRLYNQLQKDQEGKLWFREAREYTHSSIHDPSVFNTEEHREKGIELIDRARDLAERTKNWRPVQNINIALRRMVLRVNNDMARIRLAQSTNKLARDLLYDEKGNFSLNTGAMQQIREVIIPAILDQLKYIPIPRIENHEDPDYEYIIDNLVFNAANIIPEKVKITTLSQMKLKPKKMALKNAETTLRIKLKDIEVHLRNVKLWYKRKHFPKIEDDITADVDLGGETSLVIELLVAKPSEDADMFRTAVVDSNIDDLRIYATSGKHDVLMNIFTTLFSGTIKKRIKTEIDKSILNAMGVVDQTLNQVSRQLPSIQSGVQSMLYQSYDQVRQTLSEMSLAPKEEILPQEELAKIESKEEEPLLPKQKQFGYQGETGLEKGPLEKGPLEKGPLEKGPLEKRPLEKGPEPGFEKKLEFGQEKEPGLGFEKVPEQKGAQVGQEKEPGQFGYQGKIGLEKGPEVGLQKPETGFEKEKGEEFESGIQKGKLGVKKQAEVQVPEVFAPSQEQLKKGEEQKLEEKELFKHDTTPGLGLEKELISEQELAAEEFGQENVPQVEMKQTEQKLSGMKISELDKKKQEPEYSEVSESSL